MCFIQQTHFAHTLKTAAVADLTCVHCSVVHVGLLGIRLLLDVCVCACMSTVYDLLLLMVTMLNQTGVSFVTLFQLYSVISDGWLSMPIVCIMSASDKPIVSENTRSSANAEEPCEHTVS